MKTTILKASKKLAEDISKTLLASKNKKEQPLFKRRPTDKGFEITGRLGGNGNEVVVFRYVNDNGRQQFDYEERLLSFD